MNDNNNEFKEFLTLEDVAEFLGIHISTVYRYIHDKKNPLPTFRISKQVIRVKKVELDKWLETYKKENQ